MDQENINEKIAELEIVTTGCISDECLQECLGALAYGYFTGVLRDDDLINNWQIFFEKHI